MFFTKEKAKKYLEDLKKYIYQNEREIGEFNIHKGDIAEGYKNILPDNEWDIINIGDRWGGKDLTCWFRTDLRVSSDMREGKTALYLDLGTGHVGGLGGAESLIYINGVPVQALDVNHREVLLTKEVLSNDQLKIAIKAFSGLQDTDRLFKAAKVAIINEEAEDFYFRALAILETVNIMAEDNYDYQQLLKFLNSSINTIDFRQPGSSVFYQSIKEANRELKGNLKDYRNNSENRPKVTVVGHSHIDVAWLWRLCHTREKCSRTFSTVLNLMEQYPEYQYLQSTPQLYQFIKEDYPEIYEKIKEKVKEGSWEITGGMWVEADCNVPSGESLVRQFLYGTRFIEKEFGVECNILWLPDVFGYSWSLPQIIKKSGMKYFMTTKISWNQFNRPEYDTFQWRGIDGTDVLTHFITTPTEGQTLYTYNGIIDPESVQGIWDNYRQKDINDELLLAYGYGDGGGGPTKEMLEMGRKMQELPAVPEVKFGKAEPYFDRLENRVKDNSDLPVWDGELYLEYHRGTYTSQAEVKKNNRNSEILYHNLELFSSFASSIDENYTYPQSMINEGWKTILRNQFHDIIPGSSIHEVYEDSAKEFTQVIEAGNKMLDKSLEDIANKVNVDGERLVVFNSLSWSRDGLILLDWQEKFKNKIFVSLDGERLSTEIINGKNKHKQILIRLPEIPSLAYKVFKIVDKDTVQTSDAQLSDTKLLIKGNVIENLYYVIKLNDNGQVISLYDKEAEREVLPDGMKANVFQVFEDKPMNYDAWDIDIYYQEKEYVVEKLINREIVEESSERVVIRFKWEFLDSIIEQDMIVYADKRRIDFKTEVDWQQQQLLMKVAFPIDVRTTKANYEIQFGNVERPTHWNTSWDYAKFETAAQKWADLSERDYGVSLLNNCKYGYDIKDKIMRLTLIKSAIQPDPKADQGHHSFTYSIYPHLGDWYDGNVTKEAYQLNYPLLYKFADNEGGALPDSKSLLDINAESTILETVKKAEDSNSLILRFYEYGNRRDKVQLNLPDTAMILETDLMEREMKDKECIKDSKFIFEIKPYEIKTFKITFLN